MKVLALDPGPVKTGWVLYDGIRVLLSGISPNAEILKLLSQSRDVVLAVEMVASYGMPVGRDVFETVWWIGRFTQAWPDPESVIRVYRQDVKLELCGSVRAKDANVRAALIDRFGPGRSRAIGTKRQPGPLHGVSGDMWAALGVAVVAMQADRAEAA